MNIIEQTTSQETRWRLENDKTEVLMALQVCQTTPRPELHSHPAMEAGLELA
jgi:hypothetical protein